MDGKGRIRRYLREKYTINFLFLLKEDLFDEVQLFPQARQAIKYLVADGRYEYIETGSLISIRKKYKRHIQRI